MKFGGNNGRIITSNDTDDALCLETRGALRIIGICGLVGVLVDLDHIVTTFPQYHWIQGRIWHAPLFVISCLVICYMGSRVGGLYFKLVLAAVVIVTALVLAYSPWVVWGLHR